MQLNGSAQVSNFINVPVQIGSISKRIDLYVVHCNIPYLIISCRHIGLFELQLNFQNFNVYQNGHNISGDDGSTPKHVCYYNKSTQAFYETENEYDILSNKRKYNNYLQADFSNNYGHENVGNSDIESVTNNDNYGYKNINNCDNYDNANCIYDIDDNNENNDSNMNACNYSVNIDNENVTKIDTSNNYGYCYNKHVNSNDECPNEKDILTEQLQSVTPRWRKPIRKLISQFSTIFAKNKYDVGTINLDPPKIVLTSELPIAQRPYRASVKDNAEIKKQIDELLKADLIKPSCSPYAAPITLVHKKDEGSKNRLCIDYRRLNQVTKIDSEPIPRVDALLDQLSSAKIFSSCDLASGYWQVKLREADMEKLAFTSSYGLYEWKRLPFGFRNSPAIFQRAIRQILHKHQISFALNYFDDIIIFSQNFEEHLEHLKKIFQIFHLENIKLKLSKCQFAQTKIKFLGYEIENGSFSPANANIETIKKLIPPRNVKELQRFLGSINVYHKFIPNYAKVRAPLNNLLKKNISWKWTDDCQKSFQNLKDTLISKPILTLFNPQYPIHLFVDASTSGIGAVLKQMHPDGTLHPIAFHSRNLRAYEKNYAITELECLAIIDAVDKYHCYLHGTPFTIHTDHAALVWLKNIKNPTGRLFRWSLKLSMFDFNVKYQKGATNHEADMLSRNPVCHVVTTPVSSKNHLLDLYEIEEHQKRENTGGPKYKKVNNVWTITKKGLVKIIVPLSLRIKLLNKVHDEFGHPGIRSMLSLISPYYYWPSIIRDIVNFNKHCEICQINKKSKQKRFGQLESLPFVSEPFELISIDTVGGLHYPNSTKKYLHIVIDHATRFIWTFPSKSVTTDTYINCLKQIFQIKIPKKLLSDRNAAFTSSKFKHFLRNSNVTQLVTSPHRPQCNGKTERVNQTLITRLKCKINADARKVAWTKLIDQVTHEYNNTPHSVTQYPPAYLMFGVLPYSSPLLNQNPYPPVEEARITARNRTQKNHEVNKKIYDRHYKKATFKPGDLVLYENFRYPHTSKLISPYVGPFKILKQLSSVSFEIDKVNPLTNKTTEVVHSTRLRLFNPPEELKLKPSKIPIAVGGRKNKQKITPITNLGTRRESSLSLAKSQS